MKIYFFNDTTDLQLVYKKDLSGETTLLKAHTGDFFDVELKEKQVPFIKVWEDGYVLISGIDYEKSNI